MIEEIFKDFFRLEIPLPRSPLKALNSYLIKGEDRFLIIDTVRPAVRPWNPV